MKQAVIRFLKDEEGATAIEYGVIAGLMAVLLLAVFSPTGDFGTKFKNAFSALADKMNPTSSTGTTTPQ